MASINFSAGGYNFPINNLNNSGLGFFGPVGFGNSVAVGSYQDTTYVTDGNGINQGPQTNNVKWAHPNSGNVQGTIVNLLNIPNYQGTLWINFNNTTPCRTQNAKLYIYDRVSTNNPPSGVTTAVSMIVHPTLTQIGVGSGLSNWEFPSASSYVNCSILSNGAGFSPGTSGQGTGGAGTIDSNHDWYFAISASPNSIGSKTFYGLLFSTEYLSLLLAFTATLMATVIA